MVPTLHMNGTSATALIDQVANAGSAVSAAMAALAEATPNGRDYYPQGGSAIIKALKEHESRMERLRSVHDELATLMEKIDEKVQENLRDYADEGRS